MCLMSSSMGSDIWLETVLHKINSSNGISKFIFDPGAHRTPFDLSAFIDPLDSLIDPKGSISTTLAIPGLQHC
ncbi:hypothetical protein T01_4935 [Trichinella spiralis]|uniref:Uncharacterized protein n=1 Tax=Trichinella spiralis TaxID=6334 RepID=A0A0V1BQI6_TRISP|nr:hypothetical protein T01_4935 [Trichinella spiralis]